MGLAPLRSVKFHIPGHFAGKNDTLLQQQICS
jgi:hypothetical protein